MRTTAAPATHSSYSTAPQFLIGAPEIRNRRNSLQREAGHAF
jgi:hypothetical protein